MSKPPHVFIVAGGTGGHLYPGIAVAHELRKASAKVQFVVRRGDLGKNVLGREGFDVFEIAGAGLPRSLGLSTLKFPAVFWSSVREASALIRAEKPDFVLGMGGYLSFTVLWAASRAKIPTLIHEQNVVPGVANRLLSRFVDSVAVSFPESVKSFPHSKVWVAGLPVRSSIQPGDPVDARRVLSLADKLPTFFLFGGSLGAKHLNTVFLQVWRKLVQAGKVFQVIHVTGPKDFDWVEPPFRADAIPGLIMPYCHDMPRAYAAADLVICRSGASTIAELMMAQRPSILVPYPHATGDHQWFNAQVLVQRGMAKVVREANVSVDAMVGMLSEFLDHKSDLQGQFSKSQSVPFDPTAQTPAGTLASYVLEKSGL